MDGIEKECSALGGLFQLIMNDMKGSYPTWEDFVSKGAKLQSQLRTTILVTGAFLDAFQKVADMATGTRGATKEIGTALTRMCMRHRSIESKLKLFTTALSEGLISPLEQKMEEWKKVASQLDKDHAKEYKKARADIKKKSSDTIKLQKKVKKGKDEARGQLDSALQDVNVRYAVLEETEKRAVCKALIEERSRYCSFVTLLKPVLDHEINMLGEVTHLQTILEDLTSLTADPHKLPPASEQVILDLKGSDFNYTYQTPPASPNSSLSRKSSISSNYQCGSVRHVPSLDSITVDGHSQDSMGSTNQLCSSSGGGMATENGLLAPPHNTYGHPGERARAMSASGKSCSAREQLALTLGALQSDTARSSRDSLHCSSGYSTQTTTPSCSEDTIHSHVDYESISLHGDADSFSLHQLHHGLSQTDFDKSSTIPRNSDLGVQFRKFAQSKRPASTVSLLADGEMIGGSHTATIRRKPSSKPAYRRGTITGGVPIPISTPQVPLKAQLSDDNLAGAPPAGILGHNKLCTSTQSLSALPQSHSSTSVSPYYQLIPGQMPIPVPVPTIPEDNQVKQQQYMKQFQQPNPPNQVYAQPKRPPQVQQKPPLPHHLQQLVQAQNPAQNQFHQSHQPQHPNQAQFQHPNQAQFQHPNQAQFQHPNQQFQHPNQQQFHNPKEPQLQHSNQQQFQNPNEPQFRHPNQLQFQNPNEPQFQHPNQRQFQNPDEPQFKHPNQLQFQHPNQQQFQPQVQQVYYQENANSYPHDIPDHPQIPAPHPPQIEACPNLTQQQRQQLYHQQNHHQNQTLPAASLSQGDGQAPQQPQPPDLDQDEPEESPPGNMVTMIRQVKLRRTITNDRSAPMLPPPTNHN